MMRQRSSHHHFHKIIESALPAPEQQSKQRKGNHQRAAQIFTHKNTHELCGTTTRVISHLLCIPVYTLLTKLLLLTSLQSYPEIIIIMRKFRGLPVLKVIPWNFRLLLFATVCMLQQQQQLHGLVVSALLLPCPSQTSLTFSHFKKMTHLYATTTGTDNSDHKNDAVSIAKKLREQAMKLREEIAALEGKSLQDVEQEAKDKKEQQAQATQTASFAKSYSSTSDKNKVVDYGKLMDVPNGAADMVHQAARAIERAYADGIKRQTVRLALLAEGQSVQEQNEWPGGAAQMYREAAKPLTLDLLRDISISKTPMALEVTAQDIWDFDGSALIAAKVKNSTSPPHIQAMVFPNTDVKYIRDIDEMDKSIGEDVLFLLVNPFWRNLDSWGYNILAPGAKQKAQDVIFDKGYEETYSLMRFSVRGEDCVAIKAYPYDWQLYVYLENDMGWAETAIRIGSCKEEPKTDYFTSLINARPEFKLSKTMRQLTRGR